MLSSVRASVLLAVAFICLLESCSVAGYVKNAKRESRLNASVFLNNPRLAGVIQGDEFARGITVLDNKLFVVRENQINVYDTESLALIRNLTIPGSRRLWAIVASSEHNCLYISDTEDGEVYRYDLRRGGIKHLTVGGPCYGLSLTSNHTVLITMHRTKQIIEYTTYAQLVREINLDSSMGHLWQGVEAPDDQYLVSQGSVESLHRVCKVDKIGNIIQCYGAALGSDVGQLNTPTGLAVDELGNVLVADHSNNRVVLLSPALTHLGDVAIPGYSMREPWAIHLDLPARRLYIAELTNIHTRIFVLDVRSKSKQHHRGVYNQRSAVADLLINKGFQSN